MGVLLLQLGFALFEAEPKPLFNLLLLMLLGGDTFEFMWFLFLDVLFCGRLAVVGPILIGGEVASVLLGRGATFGPSSSL